MNNNKEIPQGRRTATRGRTPIDTYPPTVESPIVSNRVLAPEVPTFASPPAPARIKQPESPERPVKKGLRILPKSWLIRAGLTAAAIGGTGYAGVEAYQHFVGEERQADSNFTQHLKEIPSASKESFFDNTATRGVKTERNTVQMTREEYKKIAPPTIDRTNLKEIPVEFNLPPDTVKATGEKTRKLTLEQGTTTNAMIYVKTPEGKVREVTYTKVTSPGEITGEYPFPVLFPGCTVFLGRKGEIQAGDKLPAPISGRVYYSGSKAPAYYKGQKLEDGTNVGGDYYIEGEYYDKKTGEKFRATAQIHTLEPLTKPLVNNIPNDMDPAFNLKVKHIRDGGKEVKEVELVEYLPISAQRDKMPIVMVQQGENLLRFITKPPVQHFSSTSNVQSQVMVNVAYEGDIGENDIGNTFGGADCNHPTLDNKAIVLK